MFNCVKDSKASESWTLNSRWQIKDYKKDLRGICFRRGWWVQPYIWNKPWEEAVNPGTMTTFNRHSYMCMDGNFFEAYGPNTFKWDS